MISLQTRNAYSEVFEVMKSIDRNDLDKIPMDILIAIRDNRNEEYVPKIDFENINQSLSKKALALYIGLYRKYIVQDKEELQAINRVLYENEIKKNKGIKYDVFNNTNANEKNITEDKKEPNNELVVYKESIIQKVINILKSIFRSGGKNSGN
ncbi:MAG: hypothetical protein IKF38_06445 [Clostridia bacterium]|nr:hypothetical protein [Clostridia bacterium]